MSRLPVTSVEQPRVLPRYRPALVISAIVCGIAAHHHFRIFDSFREAFVTDAPGRRGIYTQATATSSSRARSTASPQPSAAA